MKKIVRLTESDLVRLVREVIKEQVKSGVVQKYPVKEIKSEIQVGYVSPQTGFEPLPKFASKYPKDPKGINYAKLGKTLHVAWSKAANKPSNFTGFY